MAAPRGFSLVEMMIAMFILSASILGLTAATIKVMQVNLENDVRNTAVRLTKELSEDLFAAPFGGADLAETSETIDGEKVVTPHTDSHDVKLRGAEKTFSLSWEVNLVNPDLKEVEITVSTELRGQTVRNRSVIYKHKAL